MRGAARRTAPAFLVLFLLLPLAGCGGDQKASQGQRNENGDNLACQGHHINCVNGTLIVSPQPSPTPSDSPSASASPTPDDASPSPARTPSPTPSADDEGDGDGEGEGGDDGGEAPDGSGAAASLERAQRMVLQGPVVGSLRIALLDVDSPQPRWSTRGIGARQLRAAGVGGVLFRLPAPMPASVSVDTTRAPADVEYVFFDGDGRRLGTQTAAGCAALCPSLTQNLVGAPQYQHLLVTDAGRSAGWPLGQRYLYTDD
ncbi:hypothetical protein [Streptomyces silvensis]|uniref:Lipoprotein n=1 Tax=Streptomyces silvensis TaxID=1765722 RepID=A0A0W7X5U6_9ACTN|nr:hypothetical protein [Streptomyces silvensis]KUF18252.1 hypothetical protein AT728_25130 [Streptomyces silvensis]